MLRRIMPNALPTDATARLPKARMIDPRGHRFGAGVSAVAADPRLPDRHASGWSPSSCCRSASAPRSASSTRSMASIWRRIAKTLALPKVEPEHEYPPRFAQVLGSVALTSRSSRSRSVRRRSAGACARGRRAADAARHDRLLPRLPALLPALVGAGSRDPDLDRAAATAARTGPRPGADPLPLTRSEELGRGRPPGCALAQPIIVRP